MDVFALRDQLVKDYRHYAESFLTIKDERIREHVERELDEGLLWPDPALQLNPAFESGGLDRRARRRPACCIAECCDGSSGSASAPRLGSTGEPLRLHRHQAEAVRGSARGRNYVLTTGTGSGKSLAYIVPIVDHVLRAREARAPLGQRIKAIVVYPMNALANSQEEELRKFLQQRLSGRPRAGDVPPLHRARRTTSSARRSAQHPPDILLTNYVMLEYILTRPFDRALVQAAQGLSFLVLDELHTYRGRQGADVALLVRRVRDACKATEAPVRRHVGDAGRAGHVRRAAGRGGAGRDAACSARRSSRESVIGETLAPRDREVDVDRPGFTRALAARVAVRTPRREPTRRRSAIRSRCGSSGRSGSPTTQADDRYVRCQPRPLTR